MNVVAEMIRRLRNLNPDVQFDMYGIGTLQVIVCDTPVEKLKLPDGFYTNPVYGLTNAGNSPEGSIKLPVAYSSALFASA